MAGVKRELALIADRVEDRWRPAPEIIAARKAEYARVKAAAAGGLNIIHLPDDKPFMVIVFGDEHLDNPGTDIELFEKWWFALNRDKRITGISMGDVLDSWIKPLAHLYAYTETPAPEGWQVLDYYLDERGQDLDLSVGGNHDAWAGANDLLAMMMAKHGVIHRNTSLRAGYRTPKGRVITVNARHSWPGRSQWNEVHALKKAARMGVRDNILLGGHTHVSGETMEKDPVTGKITFCYQVASFKIVDDYADQLGLMDRHTAPAVALVIDPRRADDDPDMVKHFFCPDLGKKYLKSIS